MNFLKALLFSAVEVVITGFIACCVVGTVMYCLPPTIALTNLSVLLLFAIGWWVCSFFRQWRAYDRWEDSRFWVKANKDDARYYKQVYIQQMTAASSNRRKYERERRRRKRAEETLQTERNMYNATLEATSIALQAQKDGWVNSDEQE